MITIVMIMIIIMIHNLCVSVPFFATRCIILLSKSARLQYSHNISSMTHTAHVMNSILLNRSETLPPRHLHFAHHQVIDHCAVSKLASVSRSPAAGRHLCEWCRALCSGVFWCIGACVKKKTESMREGGRVCVVCVRARDVDLLLNRAKWLCIINNLSSESRLSFSFLHCFLCHSQSRSPSLFPTSSVPF